MIDRLGRRRKKSRQKTLNRKASSVTRRIIVRIVGLIDSRSNNISWSDFLERAGARVMDRRQRIRVAAAAYSRDSSPPSQSMDPLETLETPHCSSGIWPGLLLSVRFAVHACKCIRVYRGSLAPLLLSSSHHQRRSNCDAPPTVTPLSSPGRTFSSLGIGYTPTTPHRPFIFSLEKDTKSLAYSLTDGSRIRERELRYNFLPYAFAFPFLLYYPLFVLFYT